MQFKVKIGLTRDDQATKEIQTVIRTIEDDHFGSQDIRLWLPEMIVRIPNFETAVYSSAAFEGDVIWGSAMSYQLVYPFSVSTNEINIQQLSQKLKTNFSELGYDLDISIETHPQGL